MTEKLFYTDSHLQEFTAEVVSCRPCDNGYEAVLSRTAFFPEGGGQAADTGVIDGIRVYDVQEKGEQIFHYLEGELEEGKTVTGQIDWDNVFHGCSSTAENISYRESFMHVLDMIMWDSI